MLGLPGRPLAEDAHLSGRGQPLGTGVLHPAPPAGGGAAPRSPLTTCPDPGRLHRGVRGAVEPAARSTRGAGKPVGGGGTAAATAESGQFRPVPSGPGGPLASGAGTAGGAGAAGPFGQRRHPAPAHPGAGGGTEGENRQQQRSGWGSAGAGWPGLKNCGASTSGGYPNPWPDLLPVGAGGRRRDCPVPGTGARTAGTGRAGSAAGSRQGAACSTATWNSTSRASIPSGWGLPRPRTAAQAREYGYNCLALTDTNLCGGLEFARLADSLASAHHRG